MIVSKIYGGIGNQIWQYAFGLAQSKKHNFELKLDIDILIYNPFNYTPYDFELVHFEGLNEEILTKLNLPVITEDPSHLYKEYEIKENHILDGYWQDERCFESVKDELRKKLIFKNNSIKNVNNRVFEKDSIFIHARRGDYLNGDYFVDLSKTNYYQKAVEHILAKTTSPVFHIFSNDIEWAKKYFSFIKQDKIFEEGHNTIEDLYLMSQCSHSITANSTFSWWAAWINNNEEKIIIQPSKWTKIRDLENLKMNGSIVINL
jgi:hypothetical protein